MRKLLTAVLLAPLLGVALPAFAQSYPAKPVRIVLPFGPGGVADITTRTIAPRMSEGLGQQVVVENLPGAGGIRASEAVARAEPDGHTLLLLTNGNAVSQALFKSLPYDPVNDFALISTVGFFSMVIVTGASSKDKTLQEVIAMAKANPGKLNIGTITPGRHAAPGGRAVPLQRRDRRAGRTAQDHRRGDHRRAQRQRRSRRRLHRAADLRHQVRRAARARGHGGQAPPAACRTCRPRGGRRHAVTTSPRGTRWRRRRRRRAR